MESTSAIGQQQPEWNLESDLRAAELALCSGERGAVQRSLLKRVVRYVIGFPKSGTSHDVLCIQGRPGGKQQNSVLCIPIVQDKPGLPGDKSTQNAPDRRSISVLNFDGLQLQRGPPNRAELGAAAPGLQKVESARGEVVGHGMNGFHLNSTLH